MKLLLFLKLFKPKMLETPFTFSIMRNWGALLLISRKYRNLQLPIVLDASTKLYKIGHKKTDSKRLESVFLAVARKAKSFSFFRYAYVWKLYY
ncbi:hypothetical protein AZI98_15215 [Aeribacillus pallidus]|uniref:Uncharacterized protein n=1 Tax=Aeribacillus pallidus TaxID=33936 RepID=A0A165WUR5_9BACI|nr:hypothetical protein AZI98_15215 [Aeribacillus pallidus]